jgi:hypothetical protein
MDHSPAYILAQYLIGEGDLTGPSESGSWLTYVGTLPDGDDVQDGAVAVIDTAPVKDGRIMGGEPLFHYGVQILLRSFDYNTGYSKAISLAAVLAAVDDVEVEVESDSTYALANVTQFSGVIPLGQEPGTKRRWLFSTNFLATIQEV